MSNADMPYYHVSNAFILGTLNIKVLPLLGFVHRSPSLILHGLERLTSANVAMRGSAHLPCCCFYCVHA